LKKDPELSERFYKLQPFEGLWDEGVHIGSFGNLSPFQMKPQVIKYLDAIYSFWSSLPPGSADTDTVRLLHLLCPAGLSGSADYSPPL